MLIQDKSGTMKLMPALRIRNHSSDQSQERAGRKTTLSVNDGLRLYFLLLSNGCIYFLLVVLSNMYAKLNTHAYKVYSVIFKVINQLLLRPLLLMLFH